ncbi:putative protein of unknown function (DUF4449) [Lyophyllum shimeji]|uniref:Uncharacterized protein n=1 Tax=Lyophyllum shimeji TaxID=47721 RepID=A0A9P3UML7_LYOSH|nr:putative protein of unknown function (DUF4449) [Lyophyllum shimeji]
MSLPPARKQVSERPHPNSVADPVNKAHKDKDVERKLRFYGIIEAFRLGKLPTNEQIDNALRYLLEHSIIESPALSNDGKTLVRDTRDIIETMRLMVRERNADELLQEFIWHTRSMDKEAVAGKAREAVEAGKGTIEQQREAREAEARQGICAFPSPECKLTPLHFANPAVQHLRTILSLILTNSEVRKLLTDFSVIGRDLLATGLSKAAETVAPPKEAVAEAHKPAPSDQFVSAGGKPVGTKETPVVEAKVPGTETNVQQHPKMEESPRAEKEEDVQKEEESKARETRERTGAEAGGGEHQPNVSPEQTHAREFGQEAVRTGIETDRMETTASGIGGQGAPVDRTAAGAIQDVRGEKAEAERVAKEGGAGPGAPAREEEENGEKKRSFMERLRGTRENITERMKEEHRERLERGKKFLAEEYFPPERREQFIFRAKKVIIECQKHEDYQEALRWLLSYLEESAGRIRQTTEERAKEREKVTDEAKPLQQALSELRTLLERFANGKSMDDILDAFGALADDARRDKELRDWFGAVDGYIRKVLLEPGYVVEPQCNDEANRLREDGRKFYDDKYKEHFDRLFDTTGDWFRAMGEDPINKRFGEDWARLTKDLLFDSEGSLKFKPELWNDVRKVILPQVVDKVGYIPIPRIEYTDEGLDLVVENLTLSGRNLFPNMVSLEAHNYVKFSPYRAINDEQSHRFTLTFAQMQADMRDVAFYYKKKTGVPKMKDSGLMDVLLGGTGLTATVSLVSAGQDRSSIFKVEDVHVKVDALNFSVRDSKHEFLYKTLKPIATTLIKRQIQKAVSDALVTGLEYVDGQLVRVRDRMEAARAEEGEGRTQALQNLFKREKREAEAAAAAPPPGPPPSQFKVVANKRHSLLQQAGHPAGWVNRAAELKGEVVEKGQDWRSEAFNIVA